MRREGSRGVLRVQQECPADLPLYAAAAVRSPRKQESAPLNSCRPGSIHLQTFAVEPAAAVATSRCCLELT
jgi:hypothetical protein